MSNIFSWCVLGTSLFGSKLRTVFKKHMYMSSWESELSDQFSFQWQQKKCLKLSERNFLFVFKARVLGILLQLCTVYPFSCLENIYSSTIYRYSIYEQKFSKNGKFVILKKKKLGSDTNNCWTMRTIAKELYENYFWGTIFY